MRNTRQNPLLKNNNEGGSKETLKLTDPGMTLLQEVHKSQIFMSAQFDEFNKRTQLLESENKILKSEVSNLQLRVAALELDCNALHQEVYKRYIYISGVPEKAEEKLEKIVMDIGEITGTNIVKNNIISCRRDVLNAANKLKQTHPQIIVEFDSACTKETLQANYKKQGPILLKQVDITMPSSNNTLVYLNEYLSNANKKLLYEAQQLKRKFNVKFVWAKQGTVYIRENENSKPQRIKNFNQLAMIIQQLENTSM